MYALDLDLVFKVIFLQASCGAPGLKTCTMFFITLKFGEADNTDYELFVT